MGRITYVRWLTPDDAKSVARLERSVYPREQRDGRQAIEDDLYDAQEDDRNLSVGLFDGARLIGYILAYVRENRADIFEEFEVQCAEGPELSGKSIYVEDVVVSPRFKKYSGQLYWKWQREIRKLGSGLPMDAFCSDELRQEWLRHRRLFRKLGFEMDRSLRVEDASFGQDWYWVSWRQTENEPAIASTHTLPGARLAVELPSGYRARLIQTATDWERIRSDWNQLLDTMYDGSGFMSYEYLSGWWHFFGLSNQLTIVVLYHADTIIGIAPMMIAPKRILGTYRPRLEFIGDQVNTDSPDIIVDNAVDKYRQLLWRCVLATSSQWDAIYLREQADGATTHALAEILDKVRYTLSGSPPVESPCVLLGQPWEDYLGSRSRALRKGFRRKLRRLGEQGKLEFHGYSKADDTDACLSRFLEVESRSWKGKENMGVSGNPIRRRFYRRLAATLGAKKKLHFRFLALDQLPIAGTIGLLQNGRFESLEICHDQAFDSFSPGVVLTGLELEECHALTDYREYNFLVGTYSNKRPWQTHARQVRDIYVLPRAAWGYTNRLLIFHLKPRVKHILKRYRLMDSAERVLNKLERIFR